MKKKNNKKISIKIQMLLSFFCIGIIPLLVFAIISGIIITSSMYDSEIRSLRQISSMVTENLDKWGDDNIILVEDIAASQTVLSKNFEAIRSELKNKQAQDMNILNIMYVDTNGNVMADAFGSRNEYIGDEEYFKEACNGYTYVSDVITDSRNNTSFIIFSAPVKVDNVVLGYIINKVNTNSIGESIGKITYSESGQVYTFNSDGDITYHKDSNKIMNENIINSKSKLSEGAVKALEGNFNSINYNYNGEKGVAVYNFIPSLKWGTMTTTTNSDIYAGVKNVFLGSIPGILIIMVLIFVFVLYISKVFGGIISQIDASVELNELAASAEENSRDISKAMDEIAEGSVSQAEKTDDVLNHVRELDVKMNELTEKVDETTNVLELSDKALLKGNNGTVELQKSTEEQFKLVDQAVGQVKELVDFIGNIDVIIETIRDIADQTSMLALNASIEAARAGESGKGFAVVAEEVSKLANESQKATTETADILRNVRDKADMTRKIMISIDEGMKRQTSTVEETMDIFKEITTADNRISENIKSFAGLIEYIKEFSDDLLQLIESLASSSEESAAVAEEVTASSEDQINVVGKVKASGDNILQIVNELKLNIDKFKTE